LGSFLFFSLIYHIYLINQQKYSNRRKIGFILKRHPDDRIPTFHSSGFFCPGISETNEYFANG